MQYAICTMQYAICNRMMDNSNHNDETKTVLAKWSQNAQICLRFLMTIFSQPENIYCSGGQARNLNRWIQKCDLFCNLSLINFAIWSEKGVSGRWKPGFGRNQISFFSKQRTDSIWKAALRTDWPIVATPCASSSSTTGCITWAIFQNALFLEKTYQYHL
jgi:hypothetical protein